MPLALTRAVLPAEKWRELAGEDVFFYRRCKKHMFFGAAH